MFKRVLLVLTGVMMAASATGCCCLGGCFGGNRCCSPGYGPAFAPASPCGPGGCAPSYYPPTGMNGAEFSSAFIAPTYTTTTMLPLQSLPTY